MTIDIRYANGRNKTQKIAYTSRAINVVPTGAEKNIELFYEKPFATGTMRTTFVHTIDKGHVAGNTDNVLSIFYSKAF